MDTITHALIGAVTARATTPKHINHEHITIRARMTVGGIAAAFPDTDYVTMLINPLSFIADWHRAETHSLVILPIWALLLGVVFAYLTRHKTQWRECVLICALSICTHILTDLITSWGTQIFAPISDFAPALGITFVIDPIFTLIIATALLFAIFKHSRLIARTGLVVLVSYIALQAVLKQQAENIAEAYIKKEKLTSAHVFAMPQPVSPFNWKLIVATNNQYRLAYVNLVAKKDSPLPDEKTAGFWDLPDFYQHANNLTWYRYRLYNDDLNSKIAWIHPRFERYRRFARYPALYRIDKLENDHCFWFMDLRFTLPTSTPPFRYGMCKFGKQDWQPYRLKRFTQDEREAVDYP